MERAVRIDGIFLRATDPVALARWYRTALGIDAFSPVQDAVWRPHAGPTVFAPFAADTGRAHPDGARPSSRTSALGSSSHQWAKRR